MGVRLLHAPTGRAATLFTLEENACSNPTVTSLSDVPHYESGLNNITYGMQPPAASPFSGMNCNLLVECTAVDETALVSARAFHTGTEPPAWMCRNTIGFASWWTDFHLGEDGLHHVPQKVRELGCSRLVYKHLQALPWTD